MMGSADGLGWAATDFLAQVRAGGGALRAASEHARGVRGLGELHMQRWRHVNCLGSFDFIDVGGCGSKAKVPFGRKATLVRFEKRY